ncbi:hypothetical protein [Polaromonas sp. CG9_12]|nr:hypothetical protein [Polaromonas sp. CG9_12]
MSPEMLRTELDRAEDAELQSDEQLRQLPDLIDKASTPSATLSASDCAKLVTAALAVNERLRDRTSKLRNSLNSALRSAPPTSGPKS